MAEGIIIDTSILLNHLRATGRAKTSFEKAVEKYSTIYISAITAWEIEYGAVRANRASDLADILPLVEVLPFGLAEARPAAKVYAGLITRNQNIGIRDTFIAGTCLAHNLPLLTSNTGHFRRVKELEIADL